MATRYTDSKKKEVVAFVKKYDTENGRGGQSAAKKKYKINPISIKKWCVEQGYGTAPSKKKKASRTKAKTTAKAGVKAGAKRKTTRKRAKRKTAAAPAAAKSAAAPVKAGPTLATLKKMSAITEKIESLQAEFESLKKSL